MGLDQYMYVAGKAGTDYDDPSRQNLGYRRKHPNMQGWMEKLWIEKGYPGLPASSNKFDHPFNGVELELSWEDIDRLEHDLQAGTVAQLDTTGFFFGHASDDHYREHDLEFCRAAKAELFVGRRVFYNSSW